MSSFCLVGLSRPSWRQEEADVLRWVPRESLAVVVMVVDGGDGSETAFSSHISVKDPRRIRAVALAKNWDTRGTAMIYARLLLICRLCVCPSKT